MAVADLPFDLAEVKLAPPLTRPGTVPKPDVIARLRASACPLVTVIAPAGYGKTTLLSQWAQADRRPFAWVALDGRDDDVVVLLRYIAAAIHRVQPVPPAVFDALAGPGGSALSRRVPRLGNALAALERPLVLVLDDLHTIANPSCLDALAALADYLPEGSQMAPASREEPALPLARWRAHRLVYEVGVPDLRLDEHEAELLLGVAGVTLDAGELGQLTQSTEGWPAGLYLAALSLKAGAPSSSGVASFSGDDHFVAEYFRLELLSRLPGAEARFLKHTAVLERMCGGLCDSVLQTTGSAQILETLRRANCFVVPLDRRGQWYRYHHLFGQLLCDELERSEPGIVPALNRRAMAWCLSNDLPEAAVVYAHAAGERDVVAAQIDALALPVHYDGRRETLDEWLGWFGDDELAKYPALAVEGAWVRALTGRSAEAERWLALAEGATTTIPLSDGSPTIAPWVATLRAGMMPDGVDEALADADRALDELSAGSGWRPAAFALRGTANVLLVAPDRAREDLEAAVEAGVASGGSEPVVVALAQLALLAAEQGAWGEADERVRAAETVIETNSLSDYASSALAYAAKARVALHEANGEEARAALARAHRLRPLLDRGVPWLAIQVGLELTRTHLALADPGAARTVLAEAEDVLACRPHMGTLVEQARALRDRVAATSGPTGAWAMSLTGAELRLLPYLATHLTFVEIAGRLFISRNTVKTEAVSIYRKLGVSSRSEAIARAVEVGLLEGLIYPTRADLAP